MAVVVRCLYRPGGAEARLHIRDVHVEYMIRNRHLLNTGRALVADDGQTVVGMFLVLQCDDIALAEAFLSEELSSVRSVAATHSASQEHDSSWRYDPRSEAAAIVVPTGARRTLSRFGSLQNEQVTRGKTQPRICAPSPHAIEASGLFRWRCVATGGFVA